MYFEIKGSNVRLAGTMHWVPKGQVLANWVHDAVGWARFIYLEHDKQDSDRALIAPPGSQPLALRLPHSWPRIESKYQADRVGVEQLSRRTPLAVTSAVLDLPQLDPGFELLAIESSRQILPAGPHINYLETVTQCSALEGSVSDADWDAAVSWALDNPGSGKMVLEASYRAWISGDFEEVNRISNAYTRNRFPAIRRAMIVARHELWFPIIRELAGSAHRSTLVLVGAAHLGGPEGLVVRLAAGGLTLTRVGG